jgi:hypothetical protein
MKLLEGTFGNQSFLKVFALGDAVGLLFVAITR